LYLMRGLNDPRVAGPMIDYGFTQADLEEGYQLLMEATGAKLAIPRYRAPDPSVFEELDAWENRWFPIARASLQRHDPEVGEAIFLNLSQTEGVEVAVTVGNFVRRVREAQEGTEAEQAAMQLLAKRGLDEDTLGEAEGLLGQLQQPDQAPEPPIDRSAAVDAMWGWYLEWSTIARQAITDRNLLRKLGFLRRSVVDSDEEQEEELEPKAEAPTTPVTAEADAA